jgi:hypothetical protein
VEYDLETGARKSGKSKGVVQEEEEKKEEGKIEEDNVVEDEEFMMGLG